jgi:DNA-binding YbaB/EbfC family protein
MAKGFNAPKMNQMGMMQKLQKMQEQLQQAQEQLANETVTGTAGGGAVKVVVTGDQRFVSIEIDPAVLQDGDVEMLQDMILSAVNSGLEESRKLQAERMGPLAGGLPF